MKIEQVYKRVPEKETKGCHRYALVQGTRVVDTLYVRKVAFVGRAVPDALRVTIEEHKE